MRWHVRTQRLQRRRFIRNRRRKCLRRCRTCERAPAAHELVDQKAQRESIGPIVNRPAARLFGDRYPTVRITTPGTDSVVRVTGSSGS